MHNEASGRVETTGESGPRGPLAERAEGGRRGNGIAVVRAADIQPAGVRPDGIPPGEARSGGIDIGLLLRALRRGIPLILAMALVGGVAGYKVQTLLKPRYSSFVSLILEPKKADSFGAETQFGSILVDNAKIASVVSVIESSDLLGRVVASEHLDEVPEFGDAPDPGIRKWLARIGLMPPPVVENGPSARISRATDRLERALHVDRVGVTYVLTIGIVAGDPLLAQRIAGAVADAYLNDQVERKVAVTQRDSQWLTDRLAELRRQLVGSEDALDSVRRKFGLLETGTGGTMDRQALTDLNAQVTQAQGEVARLRALYDQAAQASTGGASLEGLPDVASSHVIEGLRATQALQAQKLASLRAVYNDNFPEVRHLRDEMRAVDAQIGAEIARIVENRHAEYEAAMAREQMLSERLQQTVSAHGNTGGSTGGEGGREQVRDAQRTVDENRGLYDAMLTRWREVQQQLTREEPEGRIISQASVSYVPNFPKPLMLPAGGAAAMLFLGLGFTLVPPLLDKRFASVAGVEQRLGLPVLGAIPLLRRRDLRTARRKVSIVDYPMREPLSHFAESLRFLRTYLRISVDGSSNIIQVTSSVPGEGKSTVAAALAVSAATAGVRTVLVDADTRTSSVSAMFGLKHKDGLSDILDLGVPAGEAIHQRKDIALAIVGCGSARLSRPDMLDSDRFVALLRDLAKTYSLVILDSPPVLPVSDALVLSKHVDATLLVVQWRATSRDLVEQALKMLRAVHAPLTGVMLNKIDMSKVGEHDRGYPAYTRTAAKGR